MYTVEKFFAKIGPPDERGCTKWLNLFRDHDGYGYVTWWAQFGKKPTRAHRAVWMLRHGPIPQGMVIMHTCDVPDCMTDKHHRLGTNTDNVKDMITKGRHRDQKKTHCKRGHVFDEKNTRVRLNGNRVCKECQLQSKWERYQITRDQTT